MYPNRADVKTMYIEEKTNPYLRNIPICHIPNKNPLSLIAISSFSRNLRLKPSITPRNKYSSKIGACIKDPNDKFPNPVRVKVIENRTIESVEINSKEQNTAVRATMAQFCLVILTSFQNSSS